MFFIYGFPKQLHNLYYEKEYKIFLLLVIAVYPNTQQNRFTKLITI